MPDLLDRYRDRVVGVLSCLDRVVLTGILPGVCYAEGMTRYLGARGILLKDYPKFSLPFNEEIRSNIERIAAQESAQIEFVRSPTGFRKEARVQEVLRERGSHPGLVHILSAMESCPSFEYRGSDRTGRHRLRGRDAKCLHYYVYYQHEELGLCYLRVPTWLPCRLQFYFNGHSWLAHRMSLAGLHFQQADNAFVSISDWRVAQELADSFDTEFLHRVLDEMAERFCPVVRHFPDSYHWSIMQAEYATDILFTSTAALQPLYEGLIRTAVHAVKADNIATFLGRQVHPAFKQELGTDFHTRIEGTRIKHHMGPAAIKMYDKHSRIVRIETTVNDVSFFPHYRTVEHRDGTTSMKWAPMKKTIYSLGALSQVALKANYRYLEFLSHLVDPTAGVEKVQQVSAPVQANNRTYRGFNLFSAQDLDLFRAIVRGEFCLSGLRNAWLRRHLHGASSAQVSRLLKRLHLHGLIKKVRNTYKYHLTQLGKELATTALKVRELVVIPSLANLLPAAA